jgi:hypothetical protein
VPTEVQGRVTPLVVEGKSIAVVAARAHGDYFRQGGIYQLAASRIASL